LAIMVAIKILAIAIFLGCVAGMVVNWLRYLPGRLQGHNERTKRARNAFVGFWAVLMIDILVAGWLVSAFS